MIKNTGYKGYGRLRQKNKDTGAYTGVTKVNDPDDPDYVPPVYDTKYCEPVELYINLDRNEVDKGVSASSVVIGITSNTEWIIVLKSPFLTLDFGDSGIHDGQAVVGILENTSDARDLRFEIRSKDGSVIKEVIIHQEGVVLYKPITLAYSYSHDNACSKSEAGFNGTYYMDTDDFLIATKLTKNAQGTINASSGYYARDYQTRYWDGNQFTGKVNLCVVKPTRV